MMLKPIEVRALPDYRLWIRYADGVVGEVNLSHLVGQGVFAAWQDYQYFESVHIGPGRQIAWGDDLDLCADALYMQITGKQPQEVFPSLQAEAIYA